MIQLLQPNPVKTKPADDPKSSGYPADPNPLVNGLNPDTFTLQRKKTNTNKRKTAYCWDKCHGCDNSKKAGFKESSVNATLDKLCMWKTVLMRWIQTLPPPSLHKNEELPYSYQSTKIYYCKLAVLPFLQPVSRHWLSTSKCQFTVMQRQASSFTV